MNSYGGKPARNGRLVSAALLLGVSSLLSRVVGLVRDRVFATTFGAGDTLDAFVAAFRVPDLIFNIVVIGALSAAFIPLFTERMVNGKKAHNGEAFAFATAVFNAILLAVVALSALYALLAPQLMPLVAPGFAGQKLELTIELSRIMALQPILLAISFVFSGILNSFKRFAAYALAPILYNLGMIVGAVWLVPRIGVSGLGWGVVFGAALHALVQLPSVLRVGWRWRLVLRSQIDDLRRLWRMMLPRMFGLAAQQINLLIVTILGSGLLAGSIAVFHFANNVQYIPIGIFGIAFAQAAFPTLSEQVVRKQETAFRHTLTRTFRYILFFVIPISMFFFLLRAQIVRVLFGDGAFDWQDTILTFETFKYLIISIFAQATIPLLTRAFYARQDTKTPVVISLVAIALSVVLALWLSPWMGVQGLALAFSIASILHLVVLLGVLHWQLDGFDDREVVISVVKIVVASLAAAIVVQLLKIGIASVVDMQRFWGVLVQLVGASAGGVVAYILICWWIGSKEVLVIKRYLPRSTKLTGGTETPRFSGLLE